MKPSHRRLVLALILGAPLLYGGVVGALLMNWGNQDRARRADAIIIFGAHVQRGGDASPILRARTRHAFELWQRGLAPRIVCTGGVGTWPPAEALVQKRLLEEWGVPTSAISVDALSTSTRENARNAARLLPRGARVIAVSDPFHLWRCGRDGAKFDLRVFTSPETPGWNALQRRTRLAFLAREVIAVSRDVLFDLF